jgi:hypothetical protein
MDYKSEGKDEGDYGADAKGHADSKGGDDGMEIYADDSKGGDDGPLPVVDVVSIEFEPTGVSPVAGSLELRIRFELDRDVVAGFWVVQFLVDSCDKRIIKILGETEMEDYPDGDSEMYFRTATVDLSGVEPSSLTNSGLLMAIFMVDGKEVCTVNMVVNVFKNGSGDIVREILSPLE